MKTQRFEASTDISEFTLTEVGKEKVKLNDLIKTLKKNTSHVTIKNQLKNASKKDVLQVPLNKPQAERIKRKVAYEKVSEEVKKWDSIVQSNRTADQIIFPLNAPDNRIQPVEEVSKRYQTKNELEEEVARLLGTSENVLQQDKVLTAAEEKALKAMSLPEAKKRLAELRKMRILMSLKEAKARRQKKIKSKKYHRILKKEKMKKLMKEFDELQQTDPAAAEEKLKEADKLRILERMTLKHKSTGKWAKQQKLRAKYNIESRSALKEQMELSRTLTEKVIPVSSEPTVATIGDSVLDDEDQEGEDGDILNMYIMSSGVDMKEVNKMKAPKKTEVCQLKAREGLRAPRPAPSIIEEEEGEEEEEMEDLVYETTERIQTLDDCSDIGTAHTTSLSKKVEKKKKDTESSEKLMQDQKSSVDASQDLMEVSEVMHLESIIPNDVTFGDEEIDDEEENSDMVNMDQAFADGDIIQEFREEKEAVVAKERPEGIDTFLPGWGSWGGTGIKVSKRKRRRFYVKPEPQVRKDQTLGNVIISEEKDKKASTHQVSELPFPYKSIDQFHSIIRQPIGNTWNPQTSYEKLIAPQVVTKMGKIIAPMDPEDVDFSKKDDSDKKNKHSKIKQNKAKRKKK